MSSRRRLLIVDALGGPHPEIYVPMLPDDLDVRVVLSPPGDAKAAAAREAAVAARHPVRVEADRARLDEVVDEEARTWKADGILTFSERVVHLASRVARSLGLPANPESTQQALQDKGLQREALRRAGVPVPAFHLITGPEDLDEAVRAVGFPAVLKPRVGMGSLSVFEVTRRDELEALLESGAALYAKDPRVRGNIPRFLLEQKLVGVRRHPDPRMGDYVSVESLLGGGRILHLTVSDKPPLVYPFRETGNTLPSTLPRGLQDEILAMAEASLRAIGMTVGASHMEIKLTAEGPRVIEINGRIGGGVAEMLAFAAGYNAVAALARVALGEDPGEAPIFTGFAGFLEPQPPPYRARLVKAPTVEQLQALPGVRSAEVSLAVGAEPDWRYGASSKLARLIVSTPDRETLMSVYEQVNGDALFAFEKLD